MTARSKTISTRDRNARRKPSTHKVTREKWSAEVMKRSDAMDLKPGVFKLKSARAVALSVKKSSEASHRRRSSPFRSAMSMLNFEINRGGKTLTPERRRVLNRAKDELRKLYGRTTS
jgi:hypothetical protein